MYSIFDKLNHDIILYIIEFLNDQDKIRFVSIEQKMNLLKYHIKFYDKYEYDKIKHLSFVKNFEQIHYLSHDINIPNCITHLTFYYHFNEEIKDRIPNSVTHLTFGRKFNKEIKNCERLEATPLSQPATRGQGIPDSVTHLTFNRNFNKEIKDCIPNSVTHLTFEYRFNQEIKDCIPNSVTHLTFHKKFQKFNKNHVPSTVKYLKFINN